MAEKTKFPALGEITRPNLKTAEAAYYLNLRPQTLRAHACMDKGVVRPLRINGRLAWPVASIKAVLGVAT